jgi:hypothetical protein
LSHATRLDYPPQLQDLFWLFLFLAQYGLWSRGGGVTKQQQNIIKTALKWPQAIRLAAFFLVKAYAFA